MGRHLRAVANLFYYKIEDLIAYTTDPADGLFVFDNIDEVETHGLGLELEGSWPGGWAGRVSYTYQNAEDQETGEYHRPHHVDMKTGFYKGRQVIQVKEKY